MEKEDKREKKRGEKRDKEEEQHEKQWEEVSLLQSSPFKPKMVVEICCLYQNGCFGGLRQREFELLKLELELLKLELPLLQPTSYKEHAWERSEVKWQQAGSVSRAL